MFFLQTLRMFGWSLWIYVTHVHQEPKYKVYQETTLEGDETIEYHYEKIFYLKEKLKNQFFMIIIIT